MKPQFYTYRSFDDESFSIYGACWPSSIEDPGPDRPVQTRLEGLGLNVFIAIGGNYYIGLDWSEIEDHETGADFKARVKALLDQATGQDVICAPHAGLLWI